MTERHFHGKSHGRLHIDEDAIWPPISKPAIYISPITPAAHIQAKIKREEDFIRGHPNYAALCEEARERIVFLQSELEALEGTELNPIISGGEVLSREKTTQEIPF